MRRTTLLLRQTTKMWDVNNPLEIIPTNEPQKVTLKLLVTDVSYCHIRHRACQAVCAEGERAFIAEQRLKHVYRRAGPCAAHAHRGAGWAWRQDMDGYQLYSWALLGKAGIVDRDKVYFIPPSHSCLLCLQWTSGVV